MPHSTENVSSRKDPGPRQGLGTPFSVIPSATPDSAKQSSCSSWSSSSEGSLTDIISQLQLSTPLGLPFLGDHMSALPGPGEPTPPPIGVQSLLKGVRKAVTSSKRLGTVLGLEDLSGRKDPPRAFTCPPQVPAGLWDAFEKGWEEFYMDTIEEESISEGKEYEESFLDVAVSPTPAGYNTVGSDGARVLGADNDDSSESFQSQTFPSTSSFRGPEEVQVYGSYPDIAHQNSSHRGGTNIFPGPSLSFPSLPKPAKRTPKHDWIQRTNELFRKPSQIFQRFGAAPDDTSRHTFAGEGTHLRSFLNENLAGFLGASEGPSGPRRKPSTFFSALFRDPPSWGSTPEPEEAHVVMPHSLPIRTRIPLKRTYPSSAEEEQYEAGIYHPNSTYSLPSLSQFGPDHPVQKKARGPPSLPPRIPIPVGLPSVPPYETWIWHCPLKGNTPGLARSLLGWQAALHNAYSCAINPEYLKLHPMFPYPPCEPTHVPLIGASFWDTRVQPHREVWRIGPGDVEVLSFNTVNTFHELGNMRTQYMQENQDPNRTDHFPKLRRKFTHGSDTPYSLDMRDRALDGEGRWCFFVVRAHPTPSCGGGQQREVPGDWNPNTQRNDATPAYLVLAFPSSAITRSSECMHILYPDSSHNARTQAFQETPYSHPQPNPASMCTATALQAANTSAQNIPTVRITPPNEEDVHHTLTVRRTLLWLEKAGSVPLIEGYRTDVSAWRPFLEVVGQGKGKIVLFSSIDENRVVH